MYADPMKNNAAEKERRVNKELLEAWNMQDLPPFRGTPGDVGQLMRVFVNRDLDLQKARYTLSTGENVLIRGTAGIGKTAFMMATLHSMETEGDVLGKKVLPVHIRQFEGGNRDLFYRVILYSLAKKFSLENDAARQLLGRITGEREPTTDSTKISGGIEVSVPGFIKASGKGEIGREGESLLHITHPEHLVDELLSDITDAGYSRAVVAVDDLDRNKNQGDVIEMFESSLDLIRDGRISFMLSGRKLTLQQDVLLSAPGLDVYNLALSIEPLMPTELCDIAIRTMNLVRASPSEAETLPFTREVLEAIAEKSDGIPRFFLLLCGATLRFAFIHGDKEITPAIFEERFAEYQEEIATWEVTRETRQALFLGLRNEGLTVAKDESLDEVLDVLGVSTLREFVELAEDLVQQDLLKRSVDERSETIYKVAPGAEKLAESGAKFFERGPHK